MNIPDELAAELLAAVKRGTVEWLSPKDASAYLGGIPVKTLEHWRRQGSGPFFVRAGRNLRYARRDLDEFMLARRVHSTHDEGVDG